MDVAVEADGYVNRRGAARPCVPTRSVGTRMCLILDRQRRILFRMTRSRYRIYENYYPYFLTATIVGWLPVFTRKETVQIVLDSWRFLVENERLKIYGFVILENHLHMIASSENLAKEVGDFKSFTARTIIDHLAERNVEMLLRQLKYNKARHKDDREF
jgi:putative transposase